MKKDWLDLEWWEHPNGGIDWLILEGYFLIVWLSFGTVVLFVGWLAGWW